MDHIRCEACVGEVRGECDRYFSFYTDQLREETKFHNDVMAAFKKAGTDPNDFLEVGELEKLGRIEDQMVFSQIKRVGCAFPPETIRSLIRQTQEEV